MPEPEENPGPESQLQVCGDRKLFGVPPGLKCLLEEISREVLRNQPANINEFLANYLEEKCRRRCCGQEGEPRPASAPVAQYSKDPLNAGKEGIRDTGSKSPSCGGPSGEFASDSSNTGTTPGTGIDPILFDPAAPFGYASDGKTPCAPYGLGKNGLPLTKLDPMAPFGYHPSDGLPVATNDPTAPFGFSQSGNPLTSRDPNALLGYSVTGEINTVPETIAFCGDSVQNLIQNLTPGSRSTQLKVGDDVQVQGKESQSSQPRQSANSVSSKTKSQDGQSLAGSEAEVEAKISKKLSGSNVTLKGSVGQESRQLEGQERAEIEGQVNGFSVTGSRSSKQQSNGGSKGVLSTSQVGQDPSSSQGGRSVNSKLGQSPSNGQASSVSSKMGQGGSVSSKMGQGLSSTPQITQVLPDGTVVPLSQQGSQKLEPASVQQHQNKLGQETQTLTGMTRDVTRGGENGGVMFIGNEGASMLLSYDQTCVNPNQPPINHMANACTSGLEGRHVGVIDFAEVIRQAVESMLTRVLSIMNGIMSQNQQCQPLPGSNGVIRLSRPASQNSTGENSALDQGQGQARQEKIQSGQQGQELSVDGEQPKTSSLPQLRGTNSKLGAIPDSQNPANSNSTLSKQTLGQPGDPGHEIKEGQGPLVGAEDIFEPRTGSTASNAVASNGQETSKIHGQGQAGLTGTGSNPKSTNSQSKNKLPIDVEVKSQGGETGSHQSTNKIGSQREVDSVDGTGSHLSEKKVGEQGQVNSTGGTGSQKSVTKLPPRQIQVDANGKRKRCIPEELRPLVPGNFKCGTSAPPAEFRPSKLIQEFDTVELHPVKGHPCEGTLSNSQSPKLRSTGSLVNSRGGNSKCKKPPPIPPRKSDLRLKNVQLTRGCTTTTMREYIEGIVARASDIMKACTCLPEGSRVPKIDCVEDTSPNTSTNNEEHKLGGKHLQELVPPIAQQMVGPLTTDEETSLNLLTTVGVLLETIEDTGLTQMDPIKMCSDDTLKNLTQVSQQLLARLQDHLKKLSDTPSTSQVKTKNETDHCTEVYMSQIRKEAHEALGLAADSLQVAIGLLNDVAALCGEMNPELLAKCADDLARARENAENEIFEKTQVAQVCQEQGGAIVCEEKTIEVLCAVRNGQEICLPKSMDDEGTATEQALRNSLGMGTDPANVLAAGTDTDKDSSNVATDPDHLGFDGDTQTALSLEDKRNGPDSPGEIETGNDGYGLASGSVSKSQLNQVYGGLDGMNQHVATLFGVEGHPIGMNTVTLSGSLSKSHLDERRNFTNFPMGAISGRQSAGWISSPDGTFPGVRNADGTFSGAQNLDGTLAQGRNADGTLAETRNADGTIGGARNADGTLMLASEGQKDANWSGNVGQFMTSQMGNIQNLLSGQTPLSEARGRIIFLTVSFVIGVVVGYAISRSVGLLGFGRGGQSSVLMSGQRVIQGGCPTCGITSPNVEGGKCLIPGHAPGCGCVKK